MLKTSFYSAVIFLFVLLAYSCSDRQTTKQNKYNIAEPNDLKPTSEIKTTKIATSLLLRKNLIHDTVATYSARVISQIGEITPKDFTEITSCNKNAPILSENPFKSIFSQNHPDQITRWFLNITFDNDIFNNTDYYYTNGARIELINPITDHSPLNRILIGIKSAEKSLSGFSLTQNIYTPINPDAAEIQYNDRPFSAFLTIGQFRETFNFERKLGITSELSIGVVGPASFGGQVQTSIHIIEPYGWKNQVNNDFVINYSFHIEKGLISKPTIELNVVGKGNAGTLFNKAGGGFYFRTGRFMPVYRGPMTAFGDIRANNSLQFWFFARGITDVVLYDATLQGGMFNNNNFYVIRAESMNRVVVNASAGLALYYQNVGVEIENFYLSPEFDGAKNFFYGRIKLIVGF